MQSRRHAEASAERRSSLGRPGELIELQSMRSPSDPKLPRAQSPASPSVVAPQWPAARRMIVNSPLALERRRRAILASLRDDDGDKPCES